MKKIFYLSIAFIGFLMCPHSNAFAQGGIGINATGAPADNSAALDVNFTNKGVLLPRMSTSNMNAISSPAAGLTIFNTDCGNYYYNSGTSSNPVWSPVPSTGSVIAGVTISASPAGPICSGTSVTYTAAAVAGITASGYQWQKNGSSINGATSSTYTTSSLNNGDLITCLMSSSTNCVTGSPTTSNAIEAIINNVGTVGSINTPPNICQDSGTNIFWVNPVPGALSYTWTVSASGVSLISGFGTDSITLSIGNVTGNIGNISVVANNTCGGSNTSTTSIVVSNSAPATPGTITGQGTAYENSSVNYSISPVTFANTYFWTISGGGSMSGNTTTATATFGSDTGETIYVAAGNNCGVSSNDSFHVSLCTQTHGSRTFTYTGSMATFTLGCATSITITAVGASGGGAGNNSGYGGYATGTLSVLPGQILYVSVGGTGRDSLGGFNGGGNGGYTGSPQGGGNCESGSWSIFGYGGGGASDVRTGGTALSNRVIVAGGGGGQGSNVYESYISASNNNNPYGYNYPSTDTSQAGNGGGLQGTNATYSFYYTYFCNGWEYAMYGGQGGTQSNGGSYGAQWTSSNGAYSYGTSGQSGQGGNGDGQGTLLGGGGGGGGYYGGGGGSTAWVGGYSYPYFYASTGGGGGSSYISGLANASTLPAYNTGGNGSVTITW